MFYTYQILLSSKNSKKNNEYFLTNCNKFEVRIERIIQYQIHLCYTMHKTFILIKLKVVMNVYALIDVRMYRQACIYHNS